MTKTSSKQQTEDSFDSAKAKAGKIYSNAKEKAAMLSEQLKKQKEKLEETTNPEKAAAVTQDLIAKLAGLPIVRVNREDFLRSAFGSSPYIDEIIAHGPPAVFTVDSLRLKADEIIKNSTRKTSVASFAAGLPSNVAVMTVTAAADIVQYFGFALNMAQKIAYLFGEDNLFTTYNPTDDMVKVNGEAVPEDAQIRMIIYLGAMLGVSGAGNLIVKAANQAGEVIGKRVAAQALTKTAWYPILKNIASSIGIKITKQTVGNTISKAIPVIGGCISGAITYATFNPMGSRLADIFVKMLNGEYDVEMELNPAFLEKLNTDNRHSDDQSEVEIIDGEFSEA